MPPVPRKGGEARAPEWTAVTQPMGQCSFVTRRQAGTKMETQPASVGRGKFPRAGSVPRGGRQALSREAVSGLKHNWGRVCIPTLLSQLRKAGMAELAGSGDHS